MAAPITPRRGRLRTPELTTLVVMGAGLLVTLLGILARVLQWGRQVDIDGFVVQYRYPEASALALLGVTLFALSFLALIVLALVRRSVREEPGW